MESPRVPGKNENAGDRGRVTRTKKNQSAQAAHPRRKEERKAGKDQKGPRGDIIISRPSLVSDKVTGQKDLKRQASTQRKVMYSLRRKETRIYLIVNHLMNIDWSVML